MIQIDKFSFFNADNLEIMRGFKDNEFDLAIVDPPYGLERFKANDGGNSKKITTFGDKDKNWNNIKPDAEYWEQLFRVSKNQIVWGANNFELPPSEYFLIWDKKQPMPNFARCEFAWVSMGLKTPAKIFEFGITKHNKSKEGFHPTEKPVDLYDWLIHNYAKPNQKILDTHLGSGSIALAIDKANKLDNMNLEFVGIELDSEYYNAALNRFRLAHAQSCLSF